MRFLTHLISKRWITLLFISFLFINIGSLGAQSVKVNPLLLNGPWPAHWVHCPGISARAYGVFHFRKEISVADTPSQFIIHVSADNRYKLFINGKMIGDGPARSSLYNWNFGTYDISPFLKNGKNVIASIVWNMGEYAPVAQISNQTGFLVQGDDSLSQIANTDASWKVMRDSAYEPCALQTGSVLKSYFVTGPGDAIRGSDFPWGWEQIGYNDIGWRQAITVNTPVVTKGYGTDNLWTMSARSIPQMERKLERMNRIVSVNGLDNEQNFLDGKSELTIPAHKKVSILIDQGYETIGYPTLKVSGGDGSRIQLTYTEALLDANNQKGNRNDVKNKSVKGLYDRYYPDGGDDRVFGPLWVRTFRYMMMDIETGDRPLVINDIYNIYTAYPFIRKATFSSNDSSLDKIWEVGWRTARLCAGETYFDCPYYEQLQYEGDTRIQALISMYNTSDDRLVRKAINDFYLSRTPDGLTQGRYPSNRFQVIPPFSLWWVSMLYDYWMLRPDPDFIKSYLSAASQVLDWYEKRIDRATNMLGPLKWWNFVDWNPAFENGVPDGADQGNSSVITLQYAYTLKQASKLFAHFGQQQLSDHYELLAKKLAEATFRQCFNKDKMEMANTPKQTTFSQHAGIMAILADAVPADLENKVLDQLLADTTLSQATFYYRFYLTRAMIKAGRSSAYYGQLAPWRDMLKIGLTTFAEKPEPTRSDCHGWSASPIYDFLSTICGIMPDAPGFKKVIIQPALGDLKEVTGSMPSPAGMIQVHLKRSGNDGVEGEIDLPKGLTGKFVWLGKNYNLKPGKQKIAVIK